MRPGGAAGYDAAMGLAAVPLAAVLPIALSPMVLSPMVLSPMVLSPNASRLAAAPPADPPFSQRAGLSSVQPAALPVAPPGAAAPPAENPEVSVTFYQTAVSRRPEWMVMSGGSLFRIRTLVTSAALIRHPRGNILWDTGFRKESAHEIDEFFPWWARLTLAPEFKVDISTLLACDGVATESISAVIPSHLHWDHAAAIEEFPWAEVWTTPEERAFVHAAEPPVAVPSQFDHPAVKWKDLVFTGGPYMGFSASLDIHGDRTLVLVPLPGHTPGSLGLFVNLPDGRRLFLVGDTAWLADGVRRNAGKFFVAQWIVHEEDARAAKALAMVRSVAESNPDLQIVPSHDPDAQAAAGRVVSGCDSQAR